MKQGTFAQRIGVSEAAVSQFLAGTRCPNSDTVVRICRAMDISADWLLMGGERQRSVDRIMMQKKAIVKSARTMIRELTA